jgi:hypothetical protein
MDRSERERRMKEFEWANKNPNEALRRQREKEQTQQLAGFPEPKHNVNGKEQKKAP